MGVWVRHPNGGKIATVAVGLEEADRIMLEGGRMGITGCAATVKDRWALKDPTLVCLDVVFDEPYPFPHL